MYKVLIAFSRCETERVMALRRWKYGRKSNATRGTVIQFGLHPFYRILLPTNRREDRTWSKWGGSKSHRKNRIVVPPWEFGWVEIRVRRRILILHVRFSSRYEVSSS